MAEPDGVMIVDEGELTGHLREGIEEVLRARCPIGPVNPKVRHARRIRRVIVHYEDTFTPIRGTVYDPVNDVLPDDHTVECQADGFRDFSVGC